MIRIAALTAVLCFAVTAHAQQRPPGVICAPATWTPSATVPATGWCMWQPSYYMSPMPANLRACDIRWPAGQGEVELYDLPFAPDSTGTYYPQSASHCAVLNWSAGGYFDWLAFQYFGWQTSDGTSIRAMRIGPYTRVVFGDRPFDSAQQYRPSECNYNIATCVGTASTNQFPATFTDLWIGLPGFKMASIWIGPL